MDVDKLEKITLANLMNICRQYMQLSHLDRRTRANLYNAISGQLPNIQDAINVDVCNIIQCGIVKFGKKRGAVDDGQGPSKRQRLNTVEHEVVGMDQMTDYIGTIGEYSALNNNKYPDMIQDQKPCQKHWPHTKEWLLQFW